MSDKSNYQELYDAIDALEKSLAQRFPGLASHGFRASTRNLVLFWSGEHLYAKNEAQHESWKAKLGDALRHRCSGSDRKDVLKLTEVLPEVVEDLKEQAKGESSQLERLIKIAKECIQ